MRTTRERQRRVDVRPLRSSLVWRVSQDGLAPVNMPRLLGVAPAPRGQVMSAVISNCGLYRYRLDRMLRDDHGPTVAFVMVNPSTADATQDDATIRKCIGFAKLYSAVRL